MSRRRKPGSIPAPPEIANLFPKGLKPERAKQNNAILKYLARRDLGPPPPPKRIGTSPGGPKPGSAKAWIDDLCPNGEWRFMTGKQVHDGIAREAEKRGHKKWPSYSAVLLELRNRRRTGAQKTQK